MYSSKSNPSRLVFGKEPWLAVVLSMFFSGIGQIYSGSLLKGLIFISSQALLFCLGLWLVINLMGNTIIGLILLISTILVFLVNLFDAYESARKVNTSDFEAFRKKHKAPWLTVFFSMIIPGCGHLYVKKHLTGICLIIVSTILYITSLGSIILILFEAFIIYHAYLSSPVRRENSKNFIITITILSITFTSINYLFPLFFKSFVAESRWTPSESMKPTLQRNDRLIIDKWSYYFTAPHRGEIVVFLPTENIKKENPNLKDAFIKRII